MHDEFRTLCAIEKSSEDAYRRIAAKEISGAASLEQDVFKAMAAVATEIDRNVQFYSSMAWLCYLRHEIIRRVTIWLGDGMETAHHAEFFTAESRQQTLTGFNVEPEGILPIVNDHRLRKVAQLIGGAFVYRQLRVFQSLLALDVSFHPTGSNEFPRSNPSPEQEHNLRAFNNRCYGQPMLLVTGGGIAATTGEADTEATTFACVGFDENTGEFRVGPLGLAKFKQIRELKIIHKDRIQEIGDALLALKVGYIAARNGGLMESLTRYGMICMESPLLTQFFANAEGIVGSIEELLPTWDYSDAIATIENLKAAGSSKGYAPPVRVTGDYLALDLHSASLLLNVLLFESFDKHAPGRGRAFEDNIQQLIDQTAWKPSTEIHSWRGRKLWVGNQVLTDIDAIGEHNGTLLIVEAKAYYYSIGYGAADRSQVRNVRDNCQEAVRRCSSNTLRSASNLNLAAFRNIVRIVCTPAPVYCDAEYTIRDRYAFAPTMSFWELWKGLCE